MANETKRPSKKGMQRVNCTYCGKRHYILPEFVGYEDSALCATCKKATERGDGDEGGGCDHGLD